MKSSSEPFVPTVLCLSGLDPSGGAGLSLDVAIIRSLGMHALPIATGVAIQSSEKLFRVVPSEMDVVREQLEVLEGEFSIGSVKIGMLGSEGVGREIVHWLRERPRLPVVLDPVLRTSSGGNLGNRVDSFMIREVLPVVRVVTPNLDEASALTGLAVDTREDMIRAATALRERGVEWALVTGGHLGRGDAADYLEGPGESGWVSKPRLPYKNVRGTGCALASVLAAGLAKGDSVPEAVAEAKEWVERGIAASFRVGKHRVLGFLH